MKIKTFSRKTIAIAVAAGMSLGGVQVVSAQTGHDLSGRAVAAEANGDHRNINDQVTYDSLQFFLEDGSGLDPNKKYEDTHRVTRFKGSGKIADGAKAGDQFTITTGTENSYKRMGNLVVGKREVTKENLAPGEEDSYRSYEGTSSKLFKWGEHYTLFAKDGKTSLGDLNVDGDKMTFTLNDNVTNRQDLSFQFDIPTDFEVGSTSYYPGSKSFQYWPGDEDVPSNYDGVDNTHSEFYIYYGNGEKQKVGVYDKFTVSQYRYSELKDVHYVEEKASLTKRPSNANGTLRQDLGLIEWHPQGIGVRAINTSDEEQTARAVFTLPDEVPLTDEDIEKLARPSAGASSDDKNEFSNFLVSGYGSKEYGLERHKANKWPSGTVHYGAGEGEFLKDQKFDDYVDVSIDKEARTITWLVKVPAKSKVDIDLAKKDISTGYTSDMSNGKHKYKTTSTAEWVSDVPLTEPSSSENSWNLDLGSAGANGTNIVRKPGLEAYLNDANPDKPSGKTTDGKNSLAPTAEEAIVDNDGTANLTVALTNDKGSNISLTNPTITLPDGKKVTEKITLKPGETQYKTYKVDLSKFTKTPAKLPVSMQFAGAEKLTDEVWFTTTKTAENFDPNWADTEVPDGGSVDITPTNTKDIPKGTKYELTGKHPDWITINPDTGVITAKPPQGEEPAPHKVTVTTKYPDGSTDTDKPVITVTHSDVFIDGKPTVKPDGTVILHRNDGEDITFKVPTGSKVEVNKDGDLVITNPGEKPKTIKLKHTTITESGKPGTPDHKIIITGEDGKTHEFGTYDKYLESIKDDGKGNYTFIMNDGTKLGPIHLGDDITDIKDDGKGNLIVTHKDGSTDTVPLKHTTITETNKGKPGHTITITTPDGKKISFDAFDTYVTDVKKNAEGDYDIYRSDVNDGKTVWKTIVLSDIRGKISKLEGDLDKLTEKQKADVKNLQDEIDGLEKEIEDLQGVTDDLDNRVSKLEASLTALTLRVTSLEKRVGVLEDTDEAWAKCYAGIGESAVPLALAAPLALMSDMNIPGLAQLNTQIQRTIGIYNPEAAKWMADNRGLFTAATGVLTFAGVVAMLAHTAKECLPYNKTPGVQENMNPIIEGSSKLGEKIESGSSKPEGEAEDNGSSVDAGSSIGDGSSTESGSATGEGSSENE